MTEYHTVVRSITTEMKLLEDGEQLKALDSLTLVELVTALEEATGVDLLGMPLTIDMFRTVTSIGELLDKARSS